LNEINRRSIEEYKPSPKLEGRKLVGNRVCAEVIGHTEIEDGQGVSLDTADVTIPAHSGTPYTSVAEAPPLLRAGLELQTENTLYQLGQENR
jgi:hypothetical protein